MTKLSKKSYLIYGLGVSYFMLDQLYVQWVQYFYLPPNSTFGLKPLLTVNALVYAFILMRLIDAVADPIVGYLSDHSKSRLGKRSLFLILGGLPLSIAMILFFFPMGNTQTEIFIYFTLVGVLYFIAYTMVGGPYNALIPDIANTKEERINLSTVQSIFRLLFTALPLVFSGKIISYFASKGGAVYGFRATIIIFSILATIGVYICAFGLKENKLTVSEHKPKGASFRKTIKVLMKKNIALYFLGFFFFFCGFNLIRNIIAYYTTVILHKDTAFVTLVSAVLFGAAAVCFPITNILTKKYGFKKIMILNISLIIIGTLGLILDKTHSVGIIYLFCAIIGSGISGAAFIFPPAMLSEISNSLVKETQVSVEGLLFGIQGLFLKLAFMVQSIISIKAVVYKSIANSEGFRQPTESGVLLSLAIAIILFVLSIIFYSLKKDEN